MIVNKKVYKPFMTYCAKVIPLAFDESMSYYETICNIANHINNEIIPKVNETMETVFTLSNKFIELKKYVDDNMLTKDVSDLTYYTLTSDLSLVALTGNYNDLSNKPTIPDVSEFITKDVNDLTYYTLTSNLSNVATSGNYNDLSNKPTIPDVSNFITKDVNDLTYYTTTTSLTTLLSGKENVIENGSNTNGYYIKFDNGILIEWNRMIVDDQAIASSYGSLYQGTRNITFPIAFVGELPTVQCSEFQYGSGASWGCVVGNGTTLTGTQLRGWDCYSRATGTNCRISWFAIGKWK